MSIDSHGPSRFWDSAPSSWASAENTFAGRLCSINRRPVRVLSSYSEPGRTIDVLDPEDCAERIQQTLPVLTTDEEFIERETYLNCVKNAMGVLDLLEHCFIDVGRRDVVAQFVSAGRNAATCSFESCIRKVIDALRTALETANALTEGRYIDLENSIFLRADQDAHPPRRHEHGAYLEPGFDPGSTCLGLAEQLDDLLTMATEVMECMR